MEDTMPVGRLPQAGRTSRAPRELSKPDETNPNDRWTKVFRKQFEKTEMCRFFSSNKCKYGSKCAFAHNPDEICTPPVLDKTAICRAWSEGVCTFTARECKFAHGRGELRFTDTVKNLMKEDGSIHPQKMSPLQPVEKAAAERGRRIPGSKLESKLQDTDSPSFAALIQELQSRVMSDMSKAVVAKANSLDNAMLPPRQEQSRLRQLDKVCNPFAGSPFVGLDVLDAQFDMSSMEKPNVQRKLDNLGHLRQRPEDFAEPPKPKFCGFCGHTRGTDHAFCGDCGEPF